MVGDALVRANMRTANAPWRVRSKLSLVAGFLSLTGGIYAAIANPATRYELSIYAATPTAFWVGIGGALAVSITVAWFDPHRYGRSLACVLAVLGTGSVVALPLFRAYRFFGHADPMTHLGWVKDFATGALSPSELFYPGVHTVSVFVGRLTGMPLARSLLFVVAVFGLVYLLLFPLVVGRLLDRDRAVVLGTFTAVLLLPINLISTHLHAHPFTQTVLFSSFLLLALLRYLQSPPAKGGRSNRGNGSLLVIAIAAVVLYHPQQAANLLVVFGAISVLQFVGRWRGRPATYRTVYAHTAFFALTFAVWTLSNASFLRRPVGNLVSGLGGYLTGSASNAGSNVASQGQSLSAIGSGFVEIYLKLFSVTTVFLALAALATLAVVLNWTSDDVPDTIVGYVVFAGVALTPLPVAYFLGSVAEHYFRHFGFMMVLVALLAVVALRELEPRRLDSSRRLRTFAYEYGVPVLFAVMIPLAVLTAFPSPYIHKANRHVPSAELTGYGTALEHVDESKAIGGIRGKVDRYRDALYGSVRTGERDDDITAENMTALASYYDRGGYFILTEYERQREVAAYEELRYDRADFSTLGRQPGVDRVVANSDVTLYHTD
ncbi:hypothetical protein [Halosimplex pelagicum]|uniref:Glycosyltransferase family 39 protein n=1 Tax=Halosimplex pelagicum TaxID=869886 RepID=A0A7D5P899_9EURY|nr:hypothetical protein [Halosimplex pelagicum]QLH81184.1 hypothetical protein HZS54_05810 [Halosimplex pelagicum]